MRRYAALTLALTIGISCAPTYAAVTKRCPTTTMLLGDFGLTTLGLGIAALKWNADKHGEAAESIGLAMGLALADNIAEVRCRR